MTQKDSEDFKGTMRLVLDTTQMLKYQLEWYKGIPIHKEVAEADKNRHAKDRKDIRPDITNLQGAITNFMLAVKKKCDPATFRALVQLMQRDKLHDLSLHMDMMYGIDNVADVTKLIQDELNVQKGLLADTQNVAA